MKTQAGVAIWAVGLALLLWSCSVKSYVFLHNGSRQEIFFRLANEDYQVLDKPELVLLKTGEWKKFGAWRQSGGLVIAAGHCLYAYPEMDFGPLIDMTKAPDATPEVRQLGGRDDTVQLGEDFKIYIAPGGIELPAPLSELMPYQVAGFPIAPRSTACVR